MRFVMLTESKCSLPQHECDTAESILPAVVVGIENDRVTKESLLKRFDEFSRLDDVFSEGFIENSVLILRSEEPSVPTHTLPATLTEHLRLISAKLIFVSAAAKDLAEGPYFLRGTSLHRAWKLYRDTNSAFTVSVVPSESGAAYEYTLPSIPRPSVI